MSDDEGEQYVYSDDEYDDGADTVGGSDDVGSSAERATAAAGAGCGSSGGRGGSTFVKTGPVASSTTAADYRLLQPAEIEREQQKVIDEVAGILDIPAECANTLLIHFKWNKERLFDRYMADPKSTRAEAGIAHLGESAAPAKEFMCEMCLTDTAPADGFGLGCKHIFCRSCWAGYLTAAVTDQGQGCIQTKCPAHSDGCTEAVTMGVVAAMAPPDIAAKWRRFALQQFVDISKSMAWCPNPSCSNAFVARAPVRTAVCTCGTRFCFRCGKEAHEPVGCPQLEAWTIKCGSESENATWMLAHTKKCPLCGVRIEKNQGCNHMKCSNRGCRHEFCWICQGPWSEHGQSTGGYYKCNKYREVSLSAASSDAARAKAELDRYLFYYQRYENHEQAGRFAARHRQATARRMADLQEAGGLAYSDVTFLDDATEALLEVSASQPRALVRPKIFESCLRPTLPLMSPLCPACCSAGAPSSTRMCWASTCPRDPRRRCSSTCRSSWSAPQSTLRS